MRQTIYLKLWHKDAIDKQYFKFEITDERIPYNGIIAALQSSINPNYKLTKMPTVLKEYEGREEVKKYKKLGSFLETAMVQLSLVKLHKKDIELVNGVRVKEIYDIHKYASNIRVWDSTESGTHHIFFRMTPIHKEDSEGILKQMLKLQLMVIFNESYDIYEGKNNCLYIKDYNNTLKIDDGLNIIKMERFTKEVEHITEI